MTYDRGSTRMRQTCLILLAFWCQFFRTAECCAASRAAVQRSDPASHSNNGLRSGLGPVQMESVLSSTSTGQITRQQELSCFDFTPNCRWRNIQGYDQMEWWRGVGEPDALLLKQGTGTDKAPRAPYGIVATSRALPADNGAILASDPIQCQISNAEIRFKYWTSPGVQLRLCLKALGRDFPNYDYCTRVPAGGPGPAFVSIPGPINEPFEIFLRADGFVYQGGLVQGGYAIIDDIEYFGELCQFAPSPTESVSRREPGESSAALSNSIEQVIAPELPFRQPPNQSVDSLPPPQQQQSQPQSPQDETTTACRVLNCDFTTGSCLDWARASEWKFAKGPVGNPLTGVRGDASRLPYDTSGTYAYASGPARRLRMQTPPFTIAQPMNLMFSYYKASRDTRLQVFVQRAGEQPLSVFSAPAVSAGSRRWFREARQLEPGRYESIIFEASQLGPNSYVGIDEITLTDAFGQHIC